MAKTPKSTVDKDLVRELAALLDETGLTEIEYGKDGLSVRVSRAASAAGPQIAAAAPAAATPAADADAAPAANEHPGAVTSPMVGVVYTSPDPNSANFVKVGDQVAEGDTLMLIEAMKVFNPINAPTAGKVTQILVGNGTPVEFGEPLVILE